VSDHARVEAQHPAQLILRRRAGVEAHGEVVARLVARLVHADSLRQQEFTPVGDAAYHALLLEDELAGRKDDSVERMSG